MGTRSERVLLRLSPALRSRVGDPADLSLRADPAAGLGRRGAADAAPRRDNRMPVDRPIECTAAELAAADDSSLTERCLEVAVLAFLAALATGWLPFLAGCS